MQQIVAANATHHEYMTGDLEEDFTTRLEVASCQVKKDGRTREFETNFCPKLR